MADIFHYPLYAQEGLTQSAWVDVPTRSTSKEGTAAGSRGNVEPIRPYTRPEPRLPPPPPRGKPTGVYPYYTEASAGADSATTAKAKKVAETHRDAAMPMALIYLYPGTALCIIRHTLVNRFLPHFPRSFSIGVAMFVLLLNARYNFSLVYSRIWNI